MEFKDFIDMSSSNVDKVHLDGDRLYVIFKSGHVYRYDNVSLEVYQSFLSSESKGKYLYKYIKDVFDTKYIGTVEQFREMLEFEKSGNVAKDVRAY